LSHKPRQFIIAATSDLFIQSRLKELSDRLGHEILFTIDPQKILTQAASHPECIVILDLATTEYDSPSLAKAIKQDNHTLRILGYYPHVRTDLEREAKSAGVDYLVPNSRFLKTLREILEGKPPHP
jgi:PleD family two-component response regulator